MVNDIASRDINYLMNQLKTIDELPDFNQENGFILLASSMFLIITKLTSNVNLTATDIETAITDASWGYKNRRGDKGVDSYFVDDEEKTIHLFQSKYLTENNPAKSGEESLSFLKTPEQLMAVSSVSEYINDSIVELVRELADKVFEQDYKVHLHFVTTSTANKSNKEIYLKWEDQPWEFSIPEGRTIRPKHEATLWDYDALLNLWDSYHGINPIDIDLVINPKNSFVLKEKSSRMLVTSLKVTELMRIFKKWGFDLFRENPRGPLGNIKVNGNIGETIQDAEKKDLFHILNNGISVVCKTIEFTEYEDYFKQNNPLSEEKTTDVIVRVTDFQIVNGLQTTYTLSRLELPMIKSFYDNTYVIMKISEAPTIRNEIAITSNSQNAITGWDFVSQNSTHKSLQKGINDNSNYPFGVFYEIRRGEKDYITKGARGITKLQPKLLTQSLLAFNGDPVVAKDQIRLISNEVTENKGKFAQLYTDQINEFHVMLAYKCWIYVNNKVKEYTQKQETSSDPRLEWMSLARFHIVALIGHGMLSEIGVESLANIPIDKIEEIYKNREEKFDTHYNYALDDIEYIFDFNKDLAKRDGRIYNDRQQFKTQENWKNYLQRFITSNIRRNN